MEVSSEALAATVAGAAAVTAVVGTLAARAVDRWRRSRRARRAGAAESRAEVLLARRGYRVLERQARTRFPIALDGRRATVELRADLLVARGGRRFVAEVKAGDLVARPEHGPTRRQLLEYLVAFGVDGALLVDPRAGRVVEVGFPRLAPRAAGARAARVALAVSLAAGAVLAVGWLSGPRASVGCGEASGPPARR